MRKNHNQYYWMHYNLHDFVLDAIPQHQRTDKIKDFIYLAFNILYNRTYQTQKDLWSNIDPIECDEEVLSLIGTYHAMDLDLYGFFNTERKRWFIKNLADILNTKGTYTALYTLWKYITHSQNRLNIYERWHDKELEGKITENDYIDWLHTSFYDEADFDSGAGEAWYREYFDDVNYPESFDNRSTNYGKYQHSIDNNSVNLQFYVNDSQVNLDSVRLIGDNTVKLGEGDVDDVDTIIATQSNYNIDKSGTTWNVEHSLSRNALIVDAYDSKEYKISPKVIRIIDDNNIQLEFSEDVTGYCHISEIGNYTVDNGNIITNSLSGCYIHHDTNSEFQITHNLNNKKVIVQLYDNNSEKVSPDQINIIDSNNIEIVLNSNIETYTFIKEGIVVEPIRLRLSTQYIVEPDLSTEPIEKDKILSKETIDSLHNLWEEFRPIHRTTKYQMLVSPLTDLTKRNINLYSEELFPKLNTRSKLSISDFGDGENEYLHIEYITGKTIEIYHGLNTDKLLIDIYDKNLNQILENEINHIKIVDLNRIEVELLEERSAYALIRKGSKEFEKFRYENGVVVGNTHPLDTIKILTSFIVDNDIVEPKNVKISSEYIDFSPYNEIDKAIVYNSLYSSPVKSGNIWNIDHYLGSDALIIDVYNDKWEKVQPKSIEIVDENNVRIEFPVSIEGYCHILSVESGFTVSSEEEEINVQHNLNNKNVLVQVYDDDLNKITPKNIELVDENNLIVSIGKPIKTHTFIKSQITGYEDYSWTIADKDINFKELVSQWYNSEYTKVPDYLKILDEHTIAIEDDSIDRAVFDPVDYDVEFVSDSSTWDINHNLGNLGVYVDVYNENWEEIQPNNLELIDGNNCKITFDNPKQGFALLRKMGSPSSDKLISRLESSNLYISSKSNILSEYDFYDPSHGLPVSPIDGETYIAFNDGSGWEKYHVYRYDEDNDQWIEEIDNSDWLEVVDINRVRDEEDYVYAEYVLPRGMAINIKETLIADNMYKMFYSDYSDLYKSDDFEMNIFYRIKKSRL